VIQVNDKIRARRGIAIKFAKRPILSNIKKLAGQTLWYGIPTILSRFLGYIMNLSLPLLFAQPAKTADLTQIYAIIPFLNVLYTYGLETAYFRFSQEMDQRKLYHVLSTSLFISTIVFTGILWLGSDSIAQWASLEAHPDYVHWMIAIVFFDTLSALPFAKLRQENRPKRYAAARLLGVVINMAIVLIFLGVIPGILAANPDHWVARIYQPELGIGYYLVGNLCGSIATFLLLRSEVGQIKFTWDGEIWKKVMHYTYPLIIVGMGGMINDMLSRLVYQHWVDAPADQAKHELGIFGNVYRLAVMITIFIQAFRMAAEPFFFNQAKSENAQKTYARVMKFFVIACCFMFLLVSLYLDLFKWFFIAVDKEAWVEGLQIVPLLALGNVFLGVYYNLSIWYKLTEQNKMGAYITLAGAVITIGLNMLLIPRWHYTGAAVATFCCYLFMMIASYWLGKKYYPVPYAVKKLSAYIGLAVLLYVLHRGLIMLTDHKGFYLATATVLLGFFSWVVIQSEKKEWMALPFFSKRMQRH
jgi:O-antigen/teichoic acid export membrane protein